MSEVESAPTDPATMGQKLLAEGIGTAILVFLGCGAAFATGGDVVPTGLAFGIAIVIAAFAFGRISGAHFNPAVSVGAAIAGRISWRDTGRYAVAQVIGALVGGFALAICALAVHAQGIHWRFGDSLGNNGFGDDYGSTIHISWWGAIAVEVVLTAIFLMVILATTDARNEAHLAFAPLAIGFALAAIHFVGINLTGTSVNPARSIGVAFFSGSEAIKDLWVFIVAPLIGAAISGLLYPAIFGRDADPVPGSGLNLGGGSGGQAAFAQQWGQQTPHPAAPAQQPIIQDGWQWDPATQQWIPAQQQPPAPQAPQQAAPTPPAPTTQQLPQQDPPSGWAPPEGASEHTIVRPPQ